MQNVRTLGQPLRKTEDRRKNTVNVNGGMSGQVKRYFEYS
jgi:hypothetical protein